MPSLRARVIRLAHLNPTLRPHLLPLLSGVRLGLDRYEREMGVGLPRPAERLRAYIGKPVFIHFSYFNKMGIYPSNKFNTPTGFYAYLANKPFRPFARNRPFAIVFKPKAGASILQMNRYSFQDLKNDQDILFEWAVSRHIGEFQEIAVSARAESKDPHPAAILWNLTRLLSATLPGKSVHNWTYLFRQVLGYDGIVDPCLSIIHESEPCQAVFFDSRKLDLIEVIEVVKQGKTPASESDEQIYGRDFEGFKDFEVRIRRGAVHEGMNFSRTQHSGVSLPKTVFRNCVFRKTTFSASDLSGCVFENCDLSEAIIDNCNVSGARFDGSSFYSSTLTGVNLQGSAANGASFELTEFLGCKLGMNFSGSNFRSVYMDGSNDTQGANFSGADFTRASLQNSNLSGAIFQGAQLIDVSAERSNFSLSNLNGATISGEFDSANFERASLVGATLSGAELQEVSLVGANLRDANLSGAGLQASDVTGAILTGAILAGANLTGVDLTTAITD